MAVNGYDDQSAYGWGRALLEDEAAGFGDEVSEDALPRYIDPLNDWGFKRLFGTEMNKEFLVAFLMTIFPDIYADRAARDGRRGQERKVRRDVQG